MSIDQGEGGIGGMCLCSADWEDPGGFDSGSFYVDNPPVIDRGTIERGTADRINSTEINNPNDVRNLENLGPHPYGDPGTLGQSWNDSATVPIPWSGRF